MNRSSTGICAIVLNHFGATLTRTCALALAGQALDRLYLVDNSADANEARELNAIADELERVRARYRVQVLCNDRNLGFARGVNAAIATDRQSGGHRYYLLVNNDAVVPPGGVAALLGTIREAPRAALVSPRIRTGQRCDCWLHYFGWLGHIGFEPSRWAIPYLTGACLLIDADYIDEGGPFDEALFFYGEDILLNCRTRRRGGIVRCAEDIVVEHAGSASSGQCSPFYEYHVARSHILLAARLARSNPQRRWFLMCRFAYLTARAVLRTLRFRDLTPWRSLWRAWTEREPGNLHPARAIKGTESSA